MPDDARRPSPLVLTVTRPLTRATADDLAAHVSAAPRDAPVVIDVTGIPSFDSDGAQRLLDLQERCGSERMSIVGMRLAAARIIGVDDHDAPVPVSVAGEPMSVTRLRNTMVIRPRAGLPLLAKELEAALHAAMADDVAIVVLDLKDAPDLQPAAMAALVYASSDAAVQGRELLVVNVSPEQAERLKGSGLSSTTYVAPSPLLD